MAMPDWFPDEFAWVGRENLDERHVEQYDQKEDAHGSEEVALLRSLGLGPTDVVIEFGPGTGQFTTEVAAFCRQVIAVDVSRPMLRHLASKLERADIRNVETVHAGFLGYEHPGGPADVVYSRLALHHLPDVWKAVALSRIRRILRPGGIFRLVDVVYHFPLCELQERIEAWAARYVDAGPGQWTRADIAEHVRDEHSTFSWLLEPMMEQAGFRIERVEYADGFSAAYLLRAVESTDPAE